MALLAFVVLPELDVVKGAMLTNCLAFIPSVFGKLYVIHWGQAYLWFQAHTAWLLDNFQELNFRLPSQLKAWDSWITLDVNSNFNKPMLFHKKIILKLNEWIRNAFFICGCALKSVHVFTK